MLLPTVQQRRSERSAGHLTAILVSTPPSTVRILAMSGALSRDWGLFIKPDQDCCTLQHTQSAAIYVAHREMDGRTRKSATQSAVRKSDASVAWIGLP